MRIALLAAALAAVVGCGAGAGANAPARTSAAATSLSISYWPQGRDEGRPVKWTLRCNPAAGTLPKRAAACAKLATLRDPFARPKPGLVCTEQYGGPQQAVISGRFRGKPVWTALAARNGCEIARAKRLSFLVPGWGSTAA